jgi:hypothetical protein
MELLRTTDLARDLTQQLHTALENKDLQMCRDLLERRGQAMMDFETAHRAASELDRESCRGSMSELLKADEHLRKRSKELLEMVAAEFREQLGLPGNTIHPVGGEPLQACLDRKV